MARAQHRRADRALRRRQAPPAGVEPVLALPEIEETLWWLPEHRTLVAGDVLLGTPGRHRGVPGLVARTSASPAAIRAKLRALLDLPVERILVSHGEPVLEDGRAALERALAA